MKVISKEQREGILEDREDIQDQYVGKFGKGVGICFGHMAWHYGKNFNFSCKCSG